MRIRFPFLITSWIVCAMVLLLDAYAEPSPARIGDAWSDPRNPIVRIFSGQRLDLWSLKPILHPRPPTLTNSTPHRALNPIDAFVLSRLQSQSLHPSPPADRRTLLRRISFDLTGLPPSLDQIRSFEADRSPEAFERALDQLFSAPTYGEHTARQWLDVIRYSDSNGFDWDEFRPQAWRFRDYVIRSFNTGKPLDQMILEHLAGDEILTGPPSSPEQQDALIATGFLRLGPQDNSSALFNEQARSRSELMADLVETTSGAFLGLSFACCRCHDHKYHPLSQEDHYRLRAFFEPVRYADDLPTDLARDQKSIQSQNAAIDKQLEPLITQRTSLLNSLKPSLREAKISKLSPADLKLLSLPKDQITATEQPKLDALKKSLEVSDDEARKTLEGTNKTVHADLTKRIDVIKQSKKAFSLGLLMTDSEGPPPLTKVLFLGDHKQERNAVEPGFPSALDPNPAPLHKAPNPKTTGRRLALARWITGHGNPLTARVMANRIWQSLFTRGLVETPNDFGLAGARPTHPELLDWLARELINSGWSIKHVQRLILLSATYQQSSSTRHGEALDSENTLLWRQNPRRLTAEQLRDALLAASGELRQTTGGPPVWPELPAEILQANPAFLDDNETRTKGWYPSPESQRNVRSVFLVQKRTVRVPFMETFDLPENSTSCARRTLSTVAPQALSLMNGPMGLQAARSMAQRVIRETKDNPSERVHHAFTIALQRPPTPDELARCLRLLNSRSLEELCRVLLNLNEFIYLD